MTSADPYEITVEDEETIRNFNLLYHRVPHRTWMKTTWRGVQVGKPPTDIWRYQEIIFKCKPDLIIETGTCFGGSAYWFGDLLQIADPQGNAKVVTVDIGKAGWATKQDHPRIEFLLGDSTSSEVVAKIRKLASGAKRVMVTLDSLHTKEHVLKELALYAPLVSKGQFLVVEDTVTIGQPQQALDEWLPKHPEFEVDEESNKFFLSFSTNGFLRRVK